MMHESITGVNMHILFPLPPFMYHVYCPMPMYRYGKRVTEVKICRFGHNEFYASLGGPNCSSGSFGLGSVIFLC